MAKKNPIKKIFENTSVESADVNPESIEPAQTERPDEGIRQAEEMTTSSSGEEFSTDEPRLSDEVKDELTEFVSMHAQNEETFAEPNPQQAEVQATAKDQTDPSAISPDDLLEDVRRSLMEEEEVEQSQQESKWWRRIGKKGKAARPKEPEETIEIDLPPMGASTDLVEEQAPKQEPEEQPDEIDDLIDLLIADQEQTAAPATTATEAEPPPEPEPPVDIEKLKEQAFRPRTPEDEPESDVRAVALEGGEEVFVEVQSQVANPVEERLSAFENALKPYRWYVNIALAVFGVVVVVIVSLMMFNIYRQSQPKPTQVASNLPYPTAVSLPGGWSFQLGRGALQDGKWEPGGPEWLEGTEVCRWVALPWSRQLEAVIRTLNPKDPIELTMSNNDKLTYGVYSVRQLTPAEMQKLDSNSPCLLIILTQSDTENRWVLTGLP